MIQNVLTSPSWNNAVNTFSLCGNRKKRRIMNYLCLKTFNENFTSFLATLKPFTNGTESKSKNEITETYNYFFPFFSHFVKNLEKCIENPVELANLFKKYDRKFQMYTRYCQNKPKSEYIVSEYVETYIEVNSPYVSFFFSF